MKRPRRIAPPRPARFSACERRPSVVVRCQIYRRHRHRGQTGQDSPVKTCLAESGAVDVDLHGRTADLEVEWFGDNARKDDAAGFPMRITGTAARECRPTAPPDQKAEV